MYRRKKEIDSQMAKIGSPTLIASSFKIKVLGYKTFFMLPFFYFCGTSVRTRISRNVYMYLEYMFGFHLNKDPDIP